MAEPFRSGRVEVRQDLAVPMRDGTRLAADVYLPEGGGPAPALLMRSAYGKAIAGNKAYADPVWYAHQGFAVVSQDVRGRWDSEGDFYPYRYETDDGHDTIAWIASQPWCTGKVATYGFSYSGAVQLLVDAGAAPALAATAPGMAAGDFYEGWTYRNGAFSLNVMVGWASFLGLATAVRAGDLEAAEILDSIRASSQRHYGTLPLRETFPDEVRKYVPFFDDWLDHPSDDGYWQQLSPGRIDWGVKPALHFGGWYDVFTEGTVENYQRAVSEGWPHQQLVIGPWFHMPLTAHAGAVNFGDEGGNVIDELHVRFFSRWLGLSGNTEDEAEPPVRIFVMGENRWRELDAWPPPTSELSYHLHSDGRANSLNGTGRLSAEPPSADEPPDVFRDDPYVPVMSAGGRGCCVPGLDPMGPVDQRGQESRNEVLVYTSDVLTETLTVIGRPSVTLLVASDAVSSDYVVRLVDVRPDGSAINVCDGNVRLPPDPSQRGAVRELVLELSPTAMAFEAGHRIRLDVMGSNFPLFDRNPHSGVAPADATRADLAVATQTVFHDTRYPSRLSLPVEK